MSIHYGLGSGGLFSILSDGSVSVSTKQRKGRYLRKRPVFPKGCFIILHEAGYRTGEIAEIVGCDKSYIRRLRAKMGTNHAYLSHMRRIRTSVK